MSQFLKFDYVLKSPQYKKLLIKKGWVYVFKGIEDWKC